jgi:hypothetical protein
MRWIWYLRPILVLLLLRRGFDALLRGPEAGGRQQQVTADEFILVCARSGGLTPATVPGWDGVEVGMQRRNRKFCLVTDRRLKASLRACLTYP